MDHHAVADLPPLPPGCRFNPSDDQLLRYYLLKKNENGAAAEAASSDDRIDGYGFDVIKEVDVGKYNPFDLPEWCCYCYGYKGRKRHWYGYRVRAVKERLVRMTASGFWKRRGRVRDVVGNGGGVVLGKRVSFVFYLGDLAEGAVRTNWYMHEYALVDPKVRSGKYWNWNFVEKSCRADWFWGLGFCEGLSGKNFMPVFQSGCINYGESWSDWATRELEM